MQNDLIVESQEKYYQCYIDNGGESKYIICQLDVTYNAMCVDLIGGGLESDSDLFKEFIANVGNERCSPRYMFIALDQPYHIEIYEEFKDILKQQQRQLNQLSTDNSLNLKYKLSCLGGGIVKIDDDKQTLSCFGKSYQFGPPDIKLVKAILESTNISNYKLDIQITNEIRG
ncbi:hypothetical protein PPL_08529 [Heterostelium album PN500]|uniref:Uncharacterized protein n=1 Tax=Heterostelium pallidum (strain ATCC 26659 / Pp 5 / PN500) TaxID=670386 RepID=D3BIF9_HETP5|nr:hypothetical protein PPL_08529 [Heterostelium album PN500]EFA79059.1 hypothetical protein PPL_08529 [Heterostelium album PN500]|eukprot:XP_020431182.1 hypothetical protein PPL_08529 [Heterostelium album PN500]